MKGTKTLLSYILFMIGYQYKPICCLPEPPVCDKDNFQCASQDCIPSFWKCDSHEDCEDGSDETGCPVAVHADQGDCDEREMKCGNNKCIDVDWKCDGEDDCGDASDETNCTMSTVGPELRQCDEETNFRCGNGKCIPRAWTCNHIDDCGDNTDESTTSEPNCVPLVGCQSDYFHCNKSGLCIHNILVCDTRHNCGKDSNGVPDLSDEASCASRSCGASEFKCANHRCVSKQWRCDKQDDCGDGSDEKNCSTKACKSGYFKCATSGHCIVGFNRCDGFHDCLDGSDEQNCAASTAAPPTRRLPFTVVSKRPSSNLTTLPPTKVYTTALSCNAFQYKCKNENRCVHRTWLCDSEADCTDGSDESPEMCSSHKCAPGHFRCANGVVCIGHNNRCDGTDHCGDGSDERNCTSPFVACSDDTYKCEGSMRCIAKTSVCNGRADCPYKEDESSKCGVNECLTDNGGCPHVCVNEPLGYRCQCPLGHEYEPTTKKCLDINECKVFGKCSQSCKNYKGSFACLCDSGYSMDPLDNRTCRAGGPLPSLIFANRYDIRMISTDGREATLVRLTRSASSIDVDYTNKMIFWADNALNKIFSAHMKPTGSPKVVANVNKTEGLALDYSSGKLYWTDAERNQIVVANVDGSHRKVLVQGVESQEIRAIEVYPEKGYLYWSTWGPHCQIIRSNLDGTNQTVVAGPEHQLNWPNGLVIDKTIDRLYWTELSAIASVGLNGRHFKRIVTGLQRPHGIAVFEDSLYWTDFIEHAVYKANKFNGLDMEKYVGTFNDPEDIVVFHPLTQKEVDHPCVHEDNGGCSHLCFHTPTGSNVCACPDLMTLDKDNKTCRGPLPPTTTPSPVTTEPAPTLKTDTTSHPTSGVQVTTVVAKTPRTTLQTTATPTTTPPTTTKKVVVALPSTAAPKITTKVSVKTTQPVNPSTTAAPILPVVPVEPKTKPAEKAKPTPKTLKETTRVEEAVPTTKLETENPVKVESETEEGESESIDSPSVTDPDDVEHGASYDEEEQSDNIHLIIGIICPAAIVIFVVLGVVCYRRKKNHFDLSMVYESQRDVVHEKDEEREVETKYIIAPLHKKPTTFDNINFTNADGAVHIPLAPTEHSELIDDFSGSDRSSDDICFGEDVGFDDNIPIIDNMV